MLPLKALGENPFPACWQLPVDPSTPYVFLAYVAAALQSLLHLLMAFFPVWVWISVCPLLTKSSVTGFTSCRNSNMTVSWLLQRSFFHIRSNSEVLSRGYYSTHCTIYHHNRMNYKVVIFSFQKLKQNQVAKIRMLNRRDFCTASVCPLASLVSFDSSTCWRAWILQSLLTLMFWFWLINFLEDFLPFINTLC